MELIPLTDETNIKGNTAYLKVELTEETFCGAIAVKDYKGDIFIGNKENLFIPVVEKPQEKIVYEVRQSLTSVVIVPMGDTFTPIYEFDFRKFDIEEAFSLAYKVCESLNRGRDIPTLDKLVTTTCS